LRLKIRRLEELKVFDSLKLSMVVTTEVLTEIAADIAIDVTADIAVEAVARQED
jgi:hypothetical protein